MKKTRKAYTMEFKREAVKLVRGGLTASEVARDLGLAPTWSGAGCGKIERIRTRLSPARAS